MATTTFVDNTTVITAAWCNDVDEAVYQANADISGSVARTLTDKLTDVVSLKDFGAVGDGVTDDTAAVTAFNSSATTTDRLHIIPKGDYLNSGTVYNITSDCLYINDGFSAGVDTLGEAENKSILLVGNTPDQGGARIPSDDRTLLGITLNTTGTQHGNCARFNITNTSDEPDGNTGLYVRAISSTNSLWLAGLHSETKHLEGTTIGTNVECQSYVSGSAFIGVNIQNTTATGEIHPATSDPAVQSTTGTGLRIAGIANDLGGWKYGINIVDNTIKSDGVSIKVDSDATYGLYFTSGVVNSGADVFLEGSSANGIVCAGTYSGNAIRVKTGQAISLESTGAHKILSGTGSPEGVVTGSVGSLFCRTDGAAGTCLYVKESGSGNTGWVAK